MNIAIFGSGAMAHFLAQHTKKDPLIEEIFVYGLDVEDDSCNYIMSPKFSKDNAKNFRQYFLNAARSLKKNNVQLVITTTLPFQLWDEFQTVIKETKIPAILPTKECAMLEWDKATSKNLFKELGIPVANYRVMTKAELLKERLTFPVVVKSNNEYKEGLQTVVAYDSSILKTLTSDTYVVEEFIKGKEYSYHVLCNGYDCEFVGASRDYKKRYDGDMGFNTCGMGAYSPVPYVNHKVKDYAKKILEHLKSKGIEYRGIMYLGIMVDENNEHILLEVNTRFGCPESESWMLNLRTNTFDLFYNAAAGLPLHADFKNNSALTIRIVKKDYTGEGKEPVLDNVPENIILSRSPGLTSAYATLTTAADTVEEAAKILYDYLQDKDMGDYTYRTDIGLMP